MSQESNPFAAMASELGRDQRVIAQLAAHIEYLTQRLKMHECRVMIVDQSVQGHHAVAGDPQFISDTTNQRINDRALELKMEFVKEWHRVHDKAFAIKNEEIETLKQDNEKLREQMKIVEEAATLRGVNEVHRVYGQDMERKNLEIDGLKCERDNWRQSAERDRSRLQEIADMFTPGVCGHPEKAVELVRNLVQSKTQTPVKGLIRPIKFGTE